MTHIPSDDCPCQPVSKPVKQEDGRIDWIVVHRKV